MAASVDAVLAILLVPLGDAGRLVHVLDDLSPTDSGVVGAEGNLAQLSCVGNDAHFGAAEVIVEQILEPHSGNEQEVPRIAAALLDVFHCPVARNFSVALAG